MYRKKIGLWDLRHWLQSVVADQLGQLDQLKKKNGWALVKTYAIFWYTFFSREFHYTDLFVKGKQLISFLLKEFHEFLFCGDSSVDYHQLYQIFPDMRISQGHHGGLKRAEILTSPRYDSRSKVHTIDFWCPWIYDVPTWHDAGPLSKNHLQVVVFLWVECST